MTYLLAIKEKQYLFRAQTRFIVKQTKINTAVVQANITGNGCNKNGMFSMYRTNCKSA